MSDLTNLDFVEVFIAATPTGNGKTDISSAIGSANGVPSSDIYHEQRAAEMVAEIITKRMHEAGLMTTFKAFRCVIAVTEML